MALETATFLNGLNALNPAGPDRLMQGDDHIRLIKSVLKNTFPNLTGAMTLPQDTINGLPAKTVPVGAICLWFGSAASVPAGWAICNGATVTRSDGTGTITTPNMTDRVPVGVGDYALGATFGAAQAPATTTGLAGAHTHTGTATSAGEHSHGGSTGSTALSLAQIPAHWHGMCDNVIRNVDIPLEPNNTLAWANRDSGNEEIELASSGTQNAPLGRSGVTGSGQGHTHTVNSDGVHSHTVTVGSAGEHNHSIAAINLAQPSIALYFIMKV